MSPRTELVSNGALSGAALVGDIAALATGHGGFAAIALLPVLALCAAVAAVGCIRAATEAFTIPRTVSVDPVTGLADAAQLRDDVTAFLDDHEPGDRRTLLILDLVGFKRYNDSFGFACGDALLRRLSRKLSAEMRDRGNVYRLRGAQFAVLAPGSKSAGLRAAAADAVLEIGEGFTVRGAHGSVILPDEAREVSRALKLADQEIQSQRATLRSHGLDELTPAGYRPASRIAQSPFDVVELATAVGAHLGMTGTELDQLESAAALRDVGMIALPDELAHAASGLEGEDAEFVRLHTLSGERLLRSNFRMDGVADIVRSSHERWDGEGYPDGLAGEDIPLASRVVFVCSAFEDMTAHHAQRTVLPTDQARHELELGAGTLYDPAVVSAFVAMLTERSPAGDARLGSPPPLAG
jgi:two-component system, cell cycle response regulator